MKKLLSLITSAVLVCSMFAGEVYNFYVMKSGSAENTFASDKILYITQAVSDENGSISVTFIPKETYETADIL